MAISPQMYDSVYARAAQRRAMIRTIDRQAPALAALDSHAFLAAGDPERHAAWLRERLPPRRRPSCALLDLGCGTGRYGAWLARRLLLSLHGIDFSPVAIGIARRRNRAKDVRFDVAEFECLPLPGRSVTAAISLDALYLARDPQLALEETARVLRRGAPLLFTVYIERTGPRRTPSARQWQSMLRNARLAVDLVVDDTIRWRNLMRRKHERRWRHQHRIRKLLGTDAATQELAVSASMIGVGSPSFLDGVERLIFVARGLR